ncbi:hypothetical protein B4107_0979 [Bacillus safensis]|nr:hypothetical protein B4107_0979 [Bacillus safensis]
MGSREHVGVPPFPLSIQSSFLKPFLKESMIKKGFFYFVEK